MRTATPRPLAAQVLGPGSHRLNALFPRAREDMGVAHLTFLAVDLLFSLLMPVAYFYLLGLERPSAREATIAWTVGLSAAKILALQLALGWILRPIARWKQVQNTPEET